jgi:glycosyltransferase involved in cell wall biosynthesis
MGNAPYVYTEATDSLRDAIRKRHRTAIVLAPDWPGNSGGYSIAIKSSLELYLAHVDTVHFICTREDAFSDQGAWPADRIFWTHVPIRKRTKALRFLASLTSWAPATTVRYTQSANALLAAVTRAIASVIGDTVFIIEDIPIGWYVPELRRRWPKTPIALRSHNVLETAFTGFLKTGNPILRMAWTLEIARIARFERRVCRMVDAFWAISEDDAAVYTTRLGITPDGIVGVSSDVERYASVAPGDLKTLVHVGRADLRKSRGLRAFIDDVWPRIRAKHPEARLVLGGGGTQAFSNPDMAITGLGFVEDDRDVFNQGLLFLNPQEIGSGVQIKNINAMLAGKVVIMSPMCAQGISGEDGTHYVVADGPAAWADHILRLIRDPGMAEELGRNARSLAARVYRRDTMCKVCGPLIESFLQKADEPVSTDIRK